MEGVSEGNNNSSVEIGANMGDVPPVQAETTRETIDSAEMSINTNQGMVVDGSTTANSAGSVAETPVAEDEDNDDMAATMTPSQPVTTYEEKKSPRARNLQSIEGLGEKFDEGYDSDGQLGPFWGALTKEGQQLFDNDDEDGNCFVKEVSVEEQSNEEANTETDADTNAVISINRRT